MLRVAVLVLGLALGVTSCAFAQKHPAITSGLVAGTIGTVTCLPAVEKQTTCLWIGAVAGLAIGGITGLVTTFADTSAHQLPPFEEEEQPIVRRKKPAPPAEPAGSSATPSSPAAPAPAPAPAPSSPSSPAPPAPSATTPASPAPSAPAPASPAPASPAPAPSSPAPSSPVPAPSSPAPVDAGVPALDAGAAAPAGP